MTKPELIKVLLCDTLKKLAKKKRLDKISIQDIVQTAGISRQTFYYHFQDKKELLVWLFQNDLAQIVDQIQSPNDNHKLSKGYEHKSSYISVENIDDSDVMLRYWQRFYEYIEQNKSLYNIAFDSSYIDNLQSTLLEVHFNAYRNQILASPKGAAFTKANTDFIALYLAYASSNMLISGVIKNQYSSDDISSDLYNLSHRCLCFILDNYSF